MTDLSFFSSQRPLILAGCGNMGGALLDGWLAAGIDPGAVFIVDPQLAKEGSGRKGVACVASTADLPASIAPAMVMLAVKPQLMPVVARSSSAMRLCRTYIFVELTYGSGKADRLFHVFLRQPTTLPPLPS